MSRRAEQFFTEGNGSSELARGLPCVDNRGNDYVTYRLDQVVRGMKIDVVPFDADMAEIACFAPRRFGRGSKHPAQLNFGDCAAYALARTMGAPLLFKGNDLAQTDITPALAA